tara:strand:- start:931 stop:1170 length:240 start_codon:yes stop_codon:yes gene_type:complete
MSSPILCAFAVAAADGITSHDAVPLLVGFETELKSVRLHPTSPAALGVRLRINVHQLTGRTAGQALDVRRFFKLTVDAS